MFGLRTVVSAALGAGLLTSGSQHLLVHEGTTGARLAVIVGGILALLVVGEIIAKIRRSRHDSRVVLIR